MKSLTTIITLTGLCFFLCNGNAHAQEMEAKKFENPQWKSVVLIKFEAGKKGKAIEIIDNYFKKATEKAGTQSPMAINMRTGDYDMVLVWNMDGGIEDMNWEMSPNGVKWWAAMAEIAGSPEKAQEVWQEYMSLVDYSASNIGMAR